MVLAFAASGVKRLAFCKAAAAPIAVPAVDDVPLFKPRTDDDVPLFKPRAEAPAAAKEDEEKLPVDESVSQSGGVAPNGFEWGETF